MEEGQNEHSTIKKPDTTQLPTFTRQRHKTGMDIPRQGSVFATLRRDKAIGVMRQRNKKAGGTPGRRKPPCNKKSVYG